MNHSLGKVKKAAIAVLAVASLSVALLSSKPSQAAVATATDAAGTFKAKCAVCHGADGSGNTAMGKKLGVRDLRSAQVQNQSDAQLLGVITNGKGKMPAFGKSLSDDDRHHLVAYIRTLKK